MHEYILTHMHPAHTRTLSHLHIHTLTILHMQTYAHMHAHSYFPQEASTPVCGTVLHCLEIVALHRAHMTTHTTWDNTIAYQYYPAHHSSPVITRTSSSLVCEMIAKKKKWVGLHTAYSSLTTPT